MDFAKIIDKAAEYKAIASTLQESQEWIREFANLYAAKAISCLGLECVEKSEHSRQVRIEVEALNARMFELERKLFPNEHFQIQEYTDFVEEIVLDEDTPNIPQIDTSAPNFEAFTHKHQGLICNEPMFDLENREINSCPEPEDEFHTHKIVQEWFSDILQARLRILAIDPFCWLQCLHKDGKGARLETYRLPHECKEIGCTANLTIRRIKPNTANMDLAIYGCLGHTHKTDIPERTRELVFDNKDLAVNFIKQHFRGDFGTVDSNSYVCVRTKSIAKKVHWDCPAKFTLIRTFTRKGLWQRDVPEVIDPKKGPWTIKGTFKHNHPREVKFQRVSPKVKEFVDFYLQKGEKPSEVYKRYLQQSELAKIPGRPVTVDYIRERQRRKANDYYLLHKKYQGPHGKSANPKKGTKSPSKSGMHSGRNC